MFSLLSSLNKTGGKWAVYLSLFFLFVLLSSVIFANLLPHDPIKISLKERYAPPFWHEDGNYTYLLGTDQFGRDILTRTIYGARISLIVGIGASTLSALLGVFAGLLAGYYKGFIDTITMRLADIQLSFPFLVLAVVIIGVVGSSIPIIIIVIGLWGWAGFARVVRAKTLSECECDYVRAATSLGASSFRIIFQHILPNVFSSVIVLWTFAVAQMIILEGALSFLGLGVQPPNPSWGNIMSDGRNVIDLAWWVTFFPGMALMITVLAINTLGDTLRDVLDPRMRSVF